MTTAIAFKLFTNFVINDIRKQEQLKQEFYNSNLEIDVNNVYYGLIMINYENVTKNLIVDKDYQKVTDEIHFYYSAKNIKDLIFYKIMGFNPYIQSINILKNLTNDNCSYIYLIKNGKIYDYFFTLRIVTNDLPVYIKNLNNKTLRTFSTTKLEYIIYNNVDKVRIKTIEKSLYKYLRTKSRKYLIDMLCRYDIHVSCCMTKSRMISHVTHYLIKNSIK